VSQTDTPTTNAPGNGPEQATENTAGDSGTRAAPASSALPPDPEAYDSERNAAARARGLAAPYIPGGRDPDPEAGLQEERRYTRWLLLMVAVIIAGGFVLGIIANIYSALSGG
jgi:hypothetical protein